MQFRWKGWGDYNERLKDFKRDNKKFKKNAKRREKRTETLKKKKSLFSLIEKTRLLLKNKTK